MSQNTLMDELLLNVESKEVRLAHLKNGQLYDLTVERKKERQITGNVYKGKVTNILHNIQSAFININEGENGFIHISDILENTQRFEEVFEMNFGLDYDISKVNDSSNTKISQVLKHDQSVLVQIVKEPIGSKGARLTSNISIAGRYLVLLPNSSHRGVSKKIEDRHTRDKLKKIIRSFDIPNEMGLICRTSCRYASEEVLASEAQELFNSWNLIIEKFHEAKEPALLYEESNLIKKTLMTAIDKRYQRILVDDFTVFQTCKRLYQKYHTEHPLRIEFYRDKIPMFERFNIEKEIDKTIRRKIWLSSGGYLYFERTEAMYTIDVNSGRGSSQHQNVEEALVRVNLEAAEEIARQLRLRNIGGLVICDFIDMKIRKNQKRVLEKLKDHMKQDSAKCTILGMSDFGLIEMTRQRQRGSLMQTVFAGCPYCIGSGLIKTHESISIDIERALNKLISCHKLFALRLVVHPQLDKYLNEVDKKYFSKLTEDLHAKLTFDTDDTLHINEYNFYSTINNQKIEF